MSEDRNFGVTEAGLGLTVITCLLVALGYWIVQKLGGTGETPRVEVRQSEQANSAETAPNDLPQEAPQQPRVLTADHSESTDLQMPHTAHRPEWLAPQEGLELETAPGADSLLSPLSPDDADAAWPPAQSDPDAERGWHEPIQVR
jgi:hypothetical protein